MSDDDYDWDEPMIDDHDVTCLFCNSSFQTTCALWEHCKVAHQVDITHIKHKFSKFKVTISVCSQVSSQITCKYL